MNPNLNAILNAEADRLCRAERCESIEAPQGHTLGFLKGFQAFPRCVDVLHGCSWRLFPASQKQPRETHPE
jgi:hypothetical protein